MITRREVALGGLLSIGWLAAPCGCAAHAASGGQQIGCEVPEDSEIGVALKTEAAATRSFSRRPRFVESGNRDLDYAMAQTLSALTDCWNVLPGFAYFDDAAAPNAGATSARWLSRPDGTVIFGRRLLSKLLEMKEHPDAAIASVLAHEFGHIAQYKNKLHPTLLAGQGTVRRVELHADFLAGYFAGRRKLARPEFPASVFAKTVSGLGDYAFWQRQHHGMPHERADAIVKGFEAAYRDRRSPGEAMQIGVSYAKAA